VQSIKSAEGVGINSSNNIRAAVALSSVILRVQSICSRHTVLQWAVTKAGAQSKSKTLTVVATWKQISSKWCAKFVWQIFPARCLPTHATCYPNPRQQNDATCAQVYTWYIRKLNPTKYFDSTHARPKKINVFVKKNQAHIPSIGRVKTLPMSTVDSQSRSAASVFCHWSLLRQHEYDSTLQNSHFASNDREEKPIAAYYGVGARDILCKACSCTCQKGCVNVGEAVWHDGPLTQLCKPTPSWNE